MERRDLPVGGAAARHAGRRRPRGDRGRTRPRPVAPTGRAGARRQSRVARTAACAEASDIYLAGSDDTEPDDVSERVPTAEEFEALVARVADLEERLAEQQPRGRSGCWLRRRRATSTAPPSDCGTRRPTPDPVRAGGTVAVSASSATTSTNGCAPSALILNRRRRHHEQPRAGGVVYGRRSGRPRIGRRRDRLNRGRARFFSQPRQTNNRRR